MGTGGSAPSCSWRVIHRTSISGRVQGYSKWTVFFILAGCGNPSWGFRKRIIKELVMKFPCTHWWTLCQIYTLKRIVNDVIIRFYGGTLCRAGPLGKLIIDEYIMKLSRTFIINITEAGRKPVLYVSRLWWNKLGAARRVPRGAGTASANDGIPGFQVLKRHFALEKRNLKVCRILSRHFALGN